MPPAYPVDLRPEDRGCHTLGLARAESVRRHTPRSGSIGRPPAVSDRTRRPVSIGGRRPVPGEAPRSAGTVSGSRTRPTPLGYGVGRFTASSEQLANPALGYKFMPATGKNRCGHSILCPLRVRIVAGTPCPFGHRVPSLPSRMAKSTPRAGIHLRSWIALPQCGEVAFDGGANGCMRQCTSPTDCATSIRKVSSPH